MQMIKQEDLLAGRTFSFIHQPYLHELFETVAFSDNKITFIVGAGASLDSGFPPWRKLIERLCDELKADKMIMELARADPSDPMRKAELVIQMAMARSTSVPEELVCKALYPAELTRVERPPGPLADSLARLGIRLGDRAKLITTNFDGVLENALGRYMSKEKIFSIGLRNACNGRLDRRWTSKSGVENILHVHGMVQRNKHALEPVILTESHFLEHGPSVRKIILQQIRNSCVVFVGVSITDPNLTGPLWDATTPLRKVKNNSSATLANGEKAAGFYARPFVLIVPETGSSIYTVDDMKRYKLECAGYLEDKLRMRPIFLDSYVQQVQVLRDLDLALVAGRAKYSLNSVNVSSLAYVKRFRRTLAACYETIGWNTNDDLIPRDKASRLNSDLHEALSLNGEVGDALRALATRRRGDRYKLAAERFALFLWLYARNDDENAMPSGLDLVGTSAYIHRGNWSEFRQVQIAEHSELPVARAVYTGRYAWDNLNAGHPHGLWRGALATTVRAENNAYRQSENESSPDILTVGGISLNTTHYVQAPEDLDPERRANELSILADLSPEEMDELADILEKTAQSILGLG